VHSDAARHGRGGAGQDRAAQAVELGAAGASADPALQAWAEDIDKASGGTIKSTLFPSEQLGKAMDHYDMARDGIADFTYVNPGYQPGRFPIIAAGELQAELKNRGAAAE
jgi:TRAP-type C4-dicarboxylate transport system substrate-binding protein